MGVAEVQRLPLSAAQLGIWLGQRLLPLSSVYWTAEVVELRGALDEAALRHAIEQGVSACEALHMRFVSEGEEVWQTPCKTPWQLRCQDLSGAGDAAACEAAAQDWLEDDLRHIPDLTHGPLFASSLLRLGEDRHWWVLRAHHIVLDGYGYALLTRRVAALYTAATLGEEAVSAHELSPPRASLAAVVQEALDYQQKAEADRHFWVERLRSAAAPVSLGPPMPLAQGVRRLRTTLEPQVQTHWQQAAARCGVDWGAWVLAAVAAWLARRTGADEVILGLPVMTRLGSRALTVPCMAMNIVPLRIPVAASQGVQALAQQVAAELKTIRRHQRYRYEWLRHDLAQARGQVGQPSALFGPVVNLMPFDRPSHFGELAVTQSPVSAGPVEDLSISIVPSSQGVRVDLEANPDAYDEGSLEAIRQQLVKAFEDLAQASPEQSVASLLPAPPRAVLLGETLNPGPQDILTALQGHGARTPQACALVQEGVQLSYGELLQQVYALAGVLVSRGVTENSRVAVLLSRSPDTIVSLLAVLWAGAGYVPLDPESPEERIALVLEDAQPCLAITRSPLQAHIPTAVPTLLLDQPLPMAAALSQPVAVANDALAYVIYTSGTTGRPNGVMIGRNALAHFVAGARQRYGFTAADRVLQFAPLHFDASVEEIFTTLACGACLVLRTEAMLESIPRFLASCAEQQISVLDLPTAFWHELAYGLGDQAALAPELRLVIIGGEAALAERVQRWRQLAPAHTVLLNTYGPTETTVVCTTAQLAGPDPLDWEGETLPIGHPLPGVPVAVVDTRLRPVARGESGELCVLGNALGLGYWGREAQTTARFVNLQALPDSPRAYRTGDRVQMREDGALIYLGRLDEEFKISGYRIDPNEIETALLRHPHIEAAAVLGEVLPGGSKRLVAFWVPATAEGDAPTPGELQAHLGKSLPAPAIPSTYLPLPRLPRNANNKVDRKALRELARQQRTPAGAPSLRDDSDSLEALGQRIMGVWQDVLGVDGLTPESDFFALGGQSLQAIQVANRLGMLLQREVPVSALFQSPTIAQLAAALDVPVGHEPPAQQDPFSPLLCLQPGTGPGLFCIHPAEGLSWCYMGLAAHVRSSPIYGLQARGITGEPPEHIQAVVEDYLGLIREVQPDGPYHFIGWSSGGGIAHAIAARLQAEGAEVGVLAMMDSYPADIWEGQPPPTERDALITLLDVIGDSAQGADGSPLDVAQMKARLARPGSTLAAVGAGDPDVLNRLVDTSIQSMLLYRGLQYQHPNFAGDVLYFLATERSPKAPDWRLWEPYISGMLNVVEVASNHNGMSRPLPLAHIGRTLAAHLEAWQ